jgi:hypothetical protein
LCIRGGVHAFNVTTAGEAASYSSSASGTDLSITSASGSEPDDWFGELARPLLGKEPGVALHYITGFSASTCAKYVAKTEASRRQPPAFLLRQIIRADQGEPFFRALMDGCTAQWWLDLQHQASVGRQVLEITKRG